VFLNVFLLAVETESFIVLVYITLSACLIPLDSSNRFESILNSVSVSSSSTGSILDYDANDVIISAGLSHPQVFVADNCLVCFIEFIFRFPLL